MQGTVESMDREKSRKINDRAIWKIQQTRNSWGHSWWKVKYIFVNNTDQLEAQI